MSLEDPKLKQLDNTYTGRHCAQRTQSDPRCEREGQKLQVQGWSVRELPLSGQSCGSGNLGADTKHQASSSYRETEGEMLAGS